jgi:predicted transglutaminase-like cysteine proteinase
MRLFGTLVLCAALFGCIRHDSLYPSVTPILVVNPDQAVLVPLQESVVSVPIAESSSVPAPLAKDNVEKTEPSNSSPVEVPAPASPPVRHTTIHSYFINREVKADNIRMFPRWVNMLGRYQSESHKLNDICGDELYSACKLKDWKDFLISLRGLPLAQQLDAVNRFINKYPYIDDIVNWGIDNYWETPYEFQLKSGNCKDYAIAKFMSLRALGIPNDALRVEVVQDLNLGGVIHAVLVVFVDEKSYMLDSQIKQVITTDKVYHYVPIYSINEQHWWQHFMLD